MSFLAFSERSFQDHIGTVALPLEDEGVDGGAIRTRNALEARIANRCDCLVGEHSDWAGGFRRFNADIVNKALSKAIAIASLRREGQSGKPKIM